jgi:hypothetical protein
MHVQSHGMTLLVTPNALFKCVIEIGLICPTIPLRRNGITWVYSGIPSLIMIRFDGKGPSLRLLLKPTRY